MARILVFLIFLSVGIIARAQHARVQKFTTPVVGSVVLKNVADKYNAQVDNLEAPEPDAEEEQKKLEEIKKESRLLFPYPSENSRSKSTKRTHGNHDDHDALPPQVITGFTADTVPGVPPDNDMAISKDEKAVSVINSNIAVLDAKTGKMLYRKGLKPFSFAAGLNSSLGDTRYDPKVIYDPEADRFICIMLNSTKADNYIVVGFTKTNDPAGVWNFYKFYGNYSNDTTWFDYPSIAITKDEFFFTGNKIIFDLSWQAGFKQTVIYQLNKKNGYDSAAMTYQIWDSITYNGKTIRNLYPVKSSTGKLQSPDQYFLSNRNFDIQNDTIFMVRLPDIISSNNTNLTIKALKSPVKYGVPPEGRQPDTSVTLATNDGRILGAYAEDNEIQFVSASVSPDNGASAVYHVKIANYKNNPRIDHAAFFTIDTLDFGYPNIVYAGNGVHGPQSFISFNYTGPKTYPGMGVILYDGEEYSPLVKVKQGDTGIKISWVGPVQRWGDYMGAQPDYNTTGAAWIEGIYGRREKSGPVYIGNYGNWMAKVSSPLVQIPKTTSTLLYPNPSFQYIRFEFNVDAEQLYSFVIYDMQGKVVDKVLEQKCEEGRNRLSFNIAALSAGMYHMNVLDGNGKSISRHKFIKQ
jgi:hypothetical protein